MKTSKSINQLKLNLAKDIKAEPWKHSSNTILFSPNTQKKIRTDNINKSSELAKRLGYSKALTAAMPENEIETFIESGFRVREKLHLLALEIPRNNKAEVDHTVERYKPWQKKQILSVDSLSFDEFWKFDKRSLNRARSITPQSITKVCQKDGVVVAFAITGRSGPYGYLQRLAVHPSYKRQGIARTLVADSLNWLCRSNASIVMVNTQVGNSDALSLYEALGFKKQDLGLAVLEKDLTNEHV